MNLVVVNNMSKHSDEFQYNRFTVEKLMEAFQKATIRHGTILIPEYDLEINLTDVPEAQQSDLKDHEELIKEALSNVPMFDNIVQQECENAYKKSSLHDCFFRFSLAYLTVSKDTIELCYWGDEVNSDFDRTFIKSGNEWIQLKTRP